MTDFIRALTNFDGKESRAKIYEDAADASGFPCWIERKPMPIGAGSFPRGSRGASVLDALDKLCGEDRWERHYNPAACKGMWSLWTEWGDRDHSPFWREVERIEKQG